MATPATPAKMQPSAAPSQTTERDLTATKWVGTTFPKSVCSCKLPPEWAPTKSGQTEEQSVAKQIATLILAKLESTTNDGNGGQKSFKDEFCVWVNQHIPAFTDRFVLARLKEARGDGAITVRGVPVMMWEVHSGTKTFSDSCAHLAVLVLSQLSLLRQVLQGEHAPLKCSGLFFPKSNDDGFPLVKLTATWKTEACKFGVEVEQFDWQEDVINGVIEEAIGLANKIVSKVTETLATNLKLHHLIVLTSSELAELKTSLKIAADHDLQQQRSLGALVFKEVDQAGKAVAFWKSSPTLGNAVGVANAAHQEHSGLSDVLVLPNGQSLIPRLFYKFPAHPNLEASDLCTAHTIKLAVECLTKMHSCKLAHIDVRLPNMVWLDDERTAVKMIDLERICLVSETDFDYGSGWYPKGFCAKQLDWHQLWASVVLCNCNNLHIQKLVDVMNHLDGEFPFVALLRQGRCEDEPKLQSELHRLQSYHPQKRHKSQHEAAKETSQARSKSLEEMADA